MIKKPSYEEIVVPDEYTGKRVDTAISDLVPNITRARIKRLIEQQRILIDAQPVKPSKKLVGGEVVRIEYEEPQELEITAEDIDIDIVYEDIDIAVINKPAGMSVHPGAGIKSGTLVNALLYKCKDLSGIGGKIRPGIVHRLDKDTSGIMVVAKNDMSHNRLAEQFKSREVEKKYFALLSGTMKAKSGTISLPLGRHRTKRIKFSSDSSSAKSAVTKWKLIENYKSSCLVEAMPHTGRTHQIRVHFAEVGHPILGDRLYGHKIQDDLTNKVSKELKRQALHAFSLSFQHPRDGKLMYFEAELPEDIKHAMDRLRTNE